MKKKKENEIDLDMEYIKQNEEKNNKKCKLILKEI